MRDESVHRRGDQVRFDPELDESRNGSRRVVGVERRKHQVSSEGGVERNVSRFLIADFTHQNHVRILAHDGTKPFRESVIPAFFYLRLGNSLYFIFYRILDRNYLHVRSVELVDESVERRRLSRTGRSGREDHAVRFLDLLLHQLFGQSAQSQLLDGEHHV